MKDVHVIYTKSSRKFLRSLDSQIARRISSKINDYVHSPNPIYHSTRLVNHPLASYRFRIGEYRVLFDINENDTIQIFMILKIGHRKDIYR